MSRQHHVISYSQCKNDYLKDLYVIFFIHMSFFSAAICVLIYFVVRFDSSSVVAYSEFQGAVCGTLNVEVFPSLAALCFKSQNEKGSSA